MLRMVRAHEGPRGLRGKRCREGHSRAVKKPSRVLPRLSAARGHTNVGQTAT
eukprot:CAMPEP_0198570212 /NCGR_PEP_ID=MMETSP1462-20131121/108806_1 /TAXON_ID=1333877 /ORGANISM="Brandtodinium nutriculum, Strain RCC3387" /LENGTH=51 /DNA_ID=CAMNT_0044301329 /DNA_START=14 /DNA_END=166 /DNA_ORIENTATION=-